MATNKTRIIERLSIYDFFKKYPYVEKSLVASAMKTNKQQFTNWGKSSNKYVIEINHKKNTLSVIRTESVRASCKFNQVEYINLSEEGDKK